MGSFVTVRGKAISLETQTDTLLSRYSSYGQTTSSQADTKETSLAESIEKLLAERQEVLEQLQNICDSNANVSSSKLSQLQRHREILQQHGNTFRGIRSAIQQERSRLNLLFSVKQTLEENDNAVNTVTDEDEYINNERRNIEESHNVVDRLISQAFETRDSIASQRLSLQRSSDRLFHSLQRIPGINHVLSKINTRRRKNALILSSLITLCILFLFFTW
ncbi:HEL262Cp [Eremothecium sinecaudum]|uniref:Golgi SNAP receptor complex member 1 n=1 Tax=Eremothecium sinecaudum TaxID=45286 RepID=A0A0X8HT83_9SACH|nr:HEL262Cp [Eremothecium sinecaudum]AMD21019.1 HEL262Cp [Eremothecium sinecaudum]